MRHALIATTRRYIVWQRQPEPVLWIDSADTHGNPHHRWIVGTALYSGMSADGSLHGLLLLNEGNPRYAALTSVLAHDPLRMQRNGLLLNLCLVLLLPEMTHSTWFAQSLTAFQHTPPVSWVRWCANAMVRLHLEEAGPARMVQLTTEWRSPNAPIS